MSLILDWEGTMISLFKIYVTNYMIQKGAGGRVRTCVGLRHRFYRPTRLTTPSPQRFVNYNMEPRVGLEPTTFPLPWECSTD